MFREIFTAMRAGDIMDRAFNEFDQMIDHAHWMFAEANKVIRREADAADVRESIYERDQAVNDLLRSIRRKIVRHLTINPGDDVAAGIALVSVAKDAERIGDYCKNVFEVGRFYRSDFHVARYHEPLTEIQAEVSGLFDKVRSVFKETRATEARATIEAARDIRARCDAIIEQLLRDDTTLHIYEAVAYSLLARHYKRVSSHLANICTAVSGDVEDLDFI